MHQTNPLRFRGSLPASDFLQVAMQKNGLGGLCFTANSAAAQGIKKQSKIPCLHVPMESLGDHEAVCELWSGFGLMQEGVVGDIHFQNDQDLLFGVLHIDESDFDLVGHQTPLQQATECAYNQIFSLIAHLQFPSIFRFWNYIPDINSNADGLERYRQFNLGRHQAFLASKRDVTGNVPAACALGFNPAEKPGLSIAFLAGRVQSIAIENPRQISAYQYPEQYGPASPTFSRASLIKLKQSELLLISGTASIIGHVTQHTSDAVTQTREAITNIDAILAQANAIAANNFALDGLDYRVYVRHPKHLADIQKELIRYIGATPNIEYLQADICRQDLLLEIEASVEYPVTSLVDGKG